MAFRVSDRIRSFGHALRGISAIGASQPNAWIHAAAAAAACALGVLLELGASEWLWIVVAITIVWVAEALNTALELLADAAAPEWRPAVGRAKDAAAGGVLIAAVGAAVIGIVVFGPRLVERWESLGAGIS